MRAPFFVEVLHRNNEVLHRHQVNALPIRIGRGYDNEIILNDRHTSAHHATIDLNNDGGLVVRDLGSHNGIIHRRQRKSELPIDGNTIFRLGHTNLRVRSSDFPVENEVVDSTFHNWEGWPPALAGVCLITLLTLADTWKGDYEKFEVIRYLISIVTALCLVMIWSGLWAFANRLFGGNARLGRHLFVVGCGVAAMQLWGFISATIAFALSFEVMTRYGNHVTIAIVSTMIFFHLLLIKPDHRRLFSIVGIMLALLGSGLMLIINYNSSGRLADELYMHELLPPVVRLSTDKPVSQFIDAAAQLKSRIDDERSKAVQGEEVHD